jgi:hypothetical protein
MKVRFTDSVSTRGGAYQLGEVLDLTPEQATPFIKSGVCVVEEEDTSTAPQLNRKPRRNATLGSDLL